MENLSTVIQLYSQGEKAQLLLLFLAVAFVITTLALYLSKKQA